MDQKRMNEKMSYQELENKLRTLTLGGGYTTTPISGDTTIKGTIIKCGGGGSGSPRRGMPFEGELKSIFKEISHINWLDETDTTEKCKTLISDMLQSYEQELASLLGPCHIHDKICHTLVVLKVVGETPLSNPDIINMSAADDDEGKIIVPRGDPFWDMVVAPNLHDTYHYLTEVFRYCDKTLKNVSPNLTDNGTGDTQSQNASSGFIRHQILGLLQKAVRTLLVFLKRELINLPHELMEIFTDKANPRLLPLGDILCDLLNGDADLGIDIRCSIGLAITGLLLYQLKGWNQDAISYFEKIFTNTNSSPAVEENRNGGGTTLLENVIWTTCNDVNRIGLAVGILCSLDFEDCGSSDVTSLLHLIAKNVLDLDHGTKEALNLGTARVIEMLTDKLSNPRTPEKMLEKVFVLFGTIEFFVFSYIPGHIDAVKNCCRNTLGSLTKIYQRIEEQNLPFCTLPDLIENLLKKILSKDSHVKWIALSCVTRNSPVSIRVLKLDENMPITLLCAKRSCKNSASDSYISLMSYDFALVDRLVWEQRWILPLFEVQPNQNHEAWGQKKLIIRSILNSPKSATNLQVMLKPLLKFVINRMHSAQPGKKEIAESTLLAAETIKMASELGLQIDLESSTTPSKPESYFKGLIPRTVLNSWLWNENPQVRLAGIALLIETKKSSELITADDFDSLKILFKYNLLSQNPAYRQELMSYFKKLILRLKDGQALVKRKNDTIAFDRYAKFLIWLWNFFTEDEGLYTGANFGRRCLSLECLAELVIIFEDLSVFGVQPDNSNLKYLTWLIDTFENNKIRALEILAKMPIPAFQEETTCHTIFEEALSLCESVKPPESTTGRYLMVLLMKKTKIVKYSPENILNSLLDKLERTYASICLTSLTEVACDRPMYGMIRCIRMILNYTTDFIQKPQVFRNYFEKLIPLLLKFDEILFPLLGNAAPEGFLPGLPDSAEGNSQVVRSITAQMLLVCSWRSMRDICLLFADMCVILPLEGENPKKNQCGTEFILSFEEVSLIGDHMLHLLLNLVHRGVFEQVFVGFKTLATRLWESSNPNLCALPSKWLNEAMDEEHMSSKCITRRSAGLPFIFQALLSAECDNSTFLGDWVTRLFVRDESPLNSLVRIHSMNVLRGLFRDTIFSRAMLPFVPEGLRIAFRGLKSKDWTERNAGLMLYGALIRRTFGPKLNLMSAPIFFRRFPQMYDFLLGELDVCLKVLNNVTTVGGDGSVNVNTEENIHCSDFTFHLLLLLSSFAPAGRVEDEHFKLSEFIIKLRQCATCPDIEVRKLAAKAIIPFLHSPNDYSVALNIVSELIESNISTLSLNHVHGNLIQMAVIMEYVTKDKCTEIVVKALSSLLTIEYLSSIKCPTLFEAIAQVILAFDNFEHPTLRFLYNILTDIYHNVFNNSKISRRNIVPGLLKADATISRGEILFSLSSIPSDSHKRLCEILYHWLTSYENLAFLDQLLEIFCEVKNGDMIDTTFNILGPDSSVLLETLVSCYLNANIQYIGQSDLELKFLNIFTKVSDSAFENCLKSEETLLGLNDGFVTRLINICCGSSATTEHRRFAIITLCKLTFGTNIEIQKEHQELLCLTLIEWTNSIVDDDLRFGAALGAPRVPLDGPPLRFSVINQCKIWITIFNLAQDDDSELRNIISSKISSTSDLSACDRKSLENLVACFFENVVKHYPLEGLTVLIGLLFKDDFEIRTEEANDDEEERLFDKSEMNMFNEPIILAKVIKEYILHHNLSNSFQPHLEQSLTPELSELYELASNTKLYICSPNLSTIINLTRMRINANKADDMLENDVNHAYTNFCTMKTSLMNAVQSTVLNIVTEAFVLQ